MNNEQPQPPRDDRIVVDRECPACHGDGYIETYRSQYDQHSEGRTCYVCYGRGIVEVEVAR